MKKEPERNKLRKLKRNRRRLFSLLVFILMLIYLPALWNWLFSSNVEIGVIKTATLEIKAPLKGVFIRKEQLLASPGNGICIPTVQYGDKVAVGEELASFINSDMHTVVENYRQMRIEILKRVITQYENTTGPEREIWEDAIEKQISQLTDYTNSGNYSNVQSVRSSIDRVLDARANSMLENADSNSGLTKEKEELDRLKNNIDKSVTSIKAPSSGVVSYYCDGDESKWLPDTRDGVSVQVIDEAISKETTSEKWITPPEVELTEGKNFGKLVMNDEAWLVFYVSEDEGKLLSIQFDKLKLDNRALELEVEIKGLNKRLPVIIESVIQTTDEQYRVVARMNKYIEQTMDMRGVEGSLILKNETGMKVPLESLTGENTVDQTADIIIVDMNKATYRRVHIVAKQNSYAIIENLDDISEDKWVNVFDVYIVNPKNIEEGQAIDQ